MKDMLALRLPSAAAASGRAARGSHRRARRATAVDDFTSRSSAGRCNAGSSDSFDFGTSVSSVSSERSCASRFCSTTKIFSCDARNASTSFVNGNDLDAHVVDGNAALARGCRVASFTAPRQLPTATRPISLVPVRLDDRRRHQRLRPLELAQQAVQHDLVFGGILGVAAVLVVTRAAREVGALRRHARQRAVRDAVVVLVQVAMELRQRLDFVLRTGPCRGPVGSCRPT